MVSVPSGAASCASLRSSRVPPTNAGHDDACTLDQLAVIIGTRLKQMQYRPGLLDAFVARAGLIADPGSK